MKAVDFARPRLQPGQLPATRAALPAIIVLPLRAHADEIFPRHRTDGLTRAIIDSLSKVPDIHVINASTALKYRDPALHPRQLGAELGVHYVVSSHVVRIDQDLSFAYTLNDTLTGAHVTIGFCSAHISDFVEFEKRIVARIINNLVPSIREAELFRVFRKPMKSRTAYDLMLQALSEMESLKREGLTRAENLLDEACLLDPTFASAHAWRARAASIRVGQSWAADSQATARKALEIASHAIVLDPENSLALATAGHLNSYLRSDYERGLELLNRSLEACSNDALAWCLSSGTLTYLGRTKEARRNAEHAIWLSPLDQNIYQFYFFAGVSCYVDRDYEESVKLLRRSLAENPRYSATVKVLMAALVGADHVDEARALRGKMMRLEPNFGTNGIIKCPLRDPVAQELYRTQLRTAGIGAPQ